MKGKVEISELEAHLEKGGSTLKLIGLLSMVLSLFMFMLLDINGFLKENHYFSESINLGFDTSLIAPRAQLINRDSNHIILKSASKDRSEIIVYSEDANRFDKINGDGIEAVPSYFIQVGAFSQIKKAELVANELAKSFENPMILKHSDVVSRGDLYFVVLGTFNSQSEAENFKREHKLPGIVKNKAEMAVYDK